MRCARMWAVFFAAILAPGVARPQPELDFSGYVVHFSVWQQNPQRLRALFGLDETAWVHLSRVRVRPVLYIGSTSRVGAEYELDFLRLSAEVPYVELSAVGRRQLYDWRWEPLEKPNYRAIHYIDRLYFRQDFAWGNIVVGRQRVSWGTGRIWNPTDFFNPINPANFEKIEKDGADAISGKLYLGDLTDLQLVVNAEDHWEQKNIAARFRTNWRTYDFSVVAGHVDERTVVGGDFAGNLWDAGVRGEIAHFFKSEEGSDAFTRAILGIDYQFTPKLYGLLEYHYNGEGKRDRRRYEFLRLLRGEILNLAQNYLFLQGTYQLHPLLFILAGGCTNLDDGSQFWLLMASYSAGDNTVVSLGAQIFRGDQDAEYGLFPDAAFAKLEWYF